MKTNEILKSLRQKEGITQAEAAERLGVSLSSYQKYERDKGSIMPSLDVLMKIADLYKVTIDYLVGREPAPNPFADLGLNEASEQEMLRQYMSFEPEIRAMIMDVLIKLADSAKPEDSPPEIIEETTVGAELDRRAATDAEAEETAV